MTSRESVKFHLPTRRGFLAGGAAFAGASVAAGTSSASATSGPGGGHDGGGQWPPGPGQPNTAQHADHELRAILREIDPERIRHTVETLVGFGTRSTSSTQNDSQHGIGAARDWIASQFQEYAAASGGRMTVDVPSYIQPVAPRIPVPTRISNIRATLRGSAEPDRIYVVSGHYDSRVTDVLNGTSDAPGADDDASGTAVSMELARVMAKRAPRATLVFLAVAGEEQGLFGSNFTAQQYAAAKADIQGMLNNDIVGSSTDDDGTRDRRSVRLFAEGVLTQPPPAAPPVRRGSAHPAPVLRAGPHRHRRRERLTRPRAGPVRDRGGRPGRHGHGGPGDLPAGPVPARWRPPVVHPERLPGCGPLHRAQRELRPPAPGRPRGERCPVR